MSRFDKFMVVFGFVVLFSLILLVVNISYDYFSHYNEKQQTEYMEEN